MEGACKARWGPQDGEYAGCGVVIGESDVVAMFLVLASCEVYHFLLGWQEY